MIPLRPLEKMRLLFLTAMILVAVGCSRDPGPAIERAIQQHLSERTDLATGQMVMELKQVHVEGDSAEADVVFRTTGNPPAQMAYHYALRNEGGDWKVQGGRPSAADSTHPSANGGPEDFQGGELPEGHPPIPEGHPPIPDGHPSLPEGHPPI